MSQIEYESSEGDISDIEDEDEDEHEDDNENNDEDDDAIPASDAVEYEDDENNENEDDENEDDENTGKTELPMSGGAGEEDEDIIDDEDENYLQKFNKEIQTNYIGLFHPECIKHNYNEIKVLSIVTRDESNIIVDENHRTLPYLTKYERTRILGQRAKQINSGSKAFVNVAANIIDGYVIAEMELREKRIPFIIRRPLPNGNSEYWNINDLEIVSF